MCSSELWHDQQRQIPTQTMSSHRAKSRAHALAFLRAEILGEGHPPGGSESLPMGKRLWQNDDDESLSALEAFALGSDRKAAVDALKKDGQSSIQSDIFGGQSLLFSAFEASEQIAIYDSRRD